MSLLVVLFYIIYCFRFEFMYKLPSIFSSTLIYTVCMKTTLTCSKNSERIFLLEGPKSVTELIVTVLST